MSREARLKVTEIFHSIQGESSLTGERFSFIRLTGCPLRCTYCDTTYSYSGGQWMTITEILNAIKPHQTKWVCLTGGEPLAHPHALPLVQALYGEGYKITIETDGEEDIAPFVEYAKIIMDIKTPGSGEKSQQCFKNLVHITAKDEIKFVLTGRGDYQWARAVVGQYHLNEKCLVLFSPVYNQLSLKELTEWILEDHLPVRLQTQLHKHIWGENTKGV